MKLKKAVSLALAATMVAGMLSGCGEEKPAETTAGTQAAGEAAGSVDASKSESDSTAADIGEEQTSEGSITYPIDTDIELSLWSRESLDVNQAYASWEESPKHTAIADQTGVKIEWLYPAKGSDGNEAYNLMWMQDELPNMVYAYLTPIDGAELIADGLVYDLTEYLPEYAPDFWELINRPEYAMELKGMRTEDGKIFGLPNIKEDTYNLTWQGPYVRQDWLDECGLDYPVTVEDWENMLITFKEKYNALFISEKGGLNGSGFMASGFDALAFLSPALCVDNGEVVIAQAQPEWKEMMEVLHKWWDMGLIDKDTLTIDNDGIRNKAINNEVGVTFGAMSLGTNLRKDAAAENTGADWVGIEMPRTAAGAPTSMIKCSPSKLSNYYTVVTTGCDEEELITALKFLNYGYTEEGMLYWNFGEEGLSYTLDSDGTPQWTELITEDPAGLAAATLRYAFVGAGPSVQLAQLVKSRNDPVIAAAVDKWIANTEAPSHYLPSLSLTEEESEIYAEKWTAISTYVSEEAMKFWTGDSDLAEYDAFVEQMNKLGAQEVLDIMQAAYDRFME